MMSIHAVASAEGGIARLAFARALGKGVDVDALLRKAGLSRMQIEDPDVRISVRSQVVFLDLVAKALDDDLLGFHLAEDFDLRMIGLLYYVFASSETLGEALGRVGRYSSIVNEGFRVTVREGKEIDMILQSIGIPRRLNPNHVCFVHRRSLTSEMNNFFGCDIDFSAEIDQVTFSRAILDTNLAS